MLALVGCSSGNPPHASAAAISHDVTLTKVQRRSIRVYRVEPQAYHTRITADGVVDFDQDKATEVLAPYSGPVTKLLVRLGEHVRHGQAMALVASADFATAVGAYRKALASARAADGIAANDRVLYAHRAISERENAQAQTDAIAADADRAAALQTLVALHMDPRTIAAIRAGRPLARVQGAIRAPIAGTVVQKSIAPGQTLAAGSTPCFTIADTRRMWVMAAVFGSDVRQIASGDPAEIDPDDGGKPLAGTVTYVAAIVDPVTRSVRARVRVDNRKGVLRQGEYVAVRIESRKRLPGILVPVSAVLRDDENLPFVYVAASGGRFARRPVTLGVHIGNRFVISAGLHAGDEVVVNGSLFLRFIQSQ